MFHTNCFGEVSVLHAAWVCHAGLDMGLGCPR